MTGMKRVVALFILSLLVGSVGAQEGITCWSVTAGQSAVYHVEVDPKEFIIRPARALDKCVGREPVLSLATRKGAIAAINGGFFSIGGNHDGSPVGILKIDKTWFGLPIKPRGAIGWQEGGTVLFDRVLTHLGGIDFYIDPQTNTTTSEQWQSVDHVVGGTPLLVHSGMRIYDFSPEKTSQSFLTERHARSAIGLLRNGNWIFVVVDKDQSGDVGMTMDELASYMASLGCTEALNLDGGGSSTLFYDNRIVNHPQGDVDEQGSLRAVSDAILILPK